VLIGCYRKGEAADAQVYATAVCAVLSRYPEEVVLRVTDPVVGLPGRVNWLPTIAEVRHACEELVLPLREAALREKRQHEAQRLIGSTSNATPEERARATERWERESADMRRIQRKREMTQDEAAAKVEEFRAAPVLERKPLTLSRGLAEKLEAMKASRS
jgi:hypothetical protein